MKPYTVGFIFARGGSKGIPRKNIRQLNGKPMIAYAIETARATTLIDRVVVSTEDDEIAQIAKSYGAEVPFMRPVSLAQDNSPELLAWKHALQTLQALNPDRTIDIFVSIPVTAPLRAVEDVENCINRLIDTSADIVVTVSNARRNPYFNMMVIEQDGAAHLIIPPSQGSIPRRQDAPAAFDMTTVCYAARAAYVLNTIYLLQGKVQAVIIPEERATDIDTELDLEFVEFLLQKYRAKCAASNHY